MVDIARVRRQDVLQAMTEYDEIGAEAFLAHYGLPRDGRHAVTRAGHTYDTRAVMAVAYGYATGTALTAEELSPEDAALLARALVFDVDDAGLPPLRYARAETVGREHAHQTWALAARDRLVEAAGEYRSVVERSELADYVQRRSLIRSNQQSRTWMGDVLRRVAAQCVAAREPLLTSLVIDPHGRVGGSYARALRDLRGEEPADPDEHASRERLDCYRYFGAALPDGGGEPFVTVTAAPPRQRASRPRRTAEVRVATQPKVERTAAICPVHFIELPPTGICDLCE